MNKNSLSTYFDESNQRRWNSHISKILRCLKEHGELTNRQISRWTGLTYSQVQKRTTDSNNDHLFKEVDNVKEEGSTVAVFSINREPDLFNVKPIGLKEWMKENYPDIINQYEKIVLKNTK